jgi:hypothetical protein
MATIDTLIKINITLLTKAVAQASFSIPLIIGPTNVLNPDYVRSYTEPKAMLADGFTLSSPEYIYALELFSQDITPTIFYVGHRSVAVKQIDIITPTAVNTHLYKVSIGAANYSYTSDADATDLEIVAGLIALINADSGCPAIASGTSTLILTAKIAGVGFSTSVNADVNLALVLSVANHGIADDLNNILGQDNTPYGIILCSNDKDDLLQLAAAVEPLKKIAMVVSQDSNIPTSATTDVLSVLKGKAYDRTALVFSPVNNDKGIEAGWMGGQLPQTPGSNNWAYKTIKGCSPDPLSDNARTIIIGVPVEGIDGKNGNVYTTVGGQNVTQMGRMVSGQYIDITIGADWLESTIQTNVYQSLVSLSKIPYTNQGTGILISNVDAAIKQGIVNGLIDGKRPISITAPLVEDTPFAQRANRIAPTISFSCYLAGAFNSVKVSGTVSV